MWLFWDVAILIKLTSSLLVTQAGAEVPVLSLFVLRGGGVGRQKNAVPCTSSTVGTCQSFPGAVSCLGIDCRCQDQRGNNETGVKSFIL